MPFVVFVILAGSLVDSLLGFVSPWGQTNQIGY